MIETLAKLSPMNFQTRMKHVSKKPVVAIVRCLRWCPPINHRVLEEFMK